MQRTVNKSTKLKANKSEQMRERLRPISLEQPIVESPFAQMLDARPIIKSEQSDIDKNQAQPITSNESESQTKELSTVNPTQKQDFPNHQEEQGTDLQVTDNLPTRSLNNGALTAKKLCKILEIDELDEIFNLSDVLKSSSLKLYAALAGLADKNGKLKIKAHELMKESGIKGIATFYKQERWLADLGLIEKRAKPGPHEGSSYRVYSLLSLPLPKEIIEEFEDHAAKL